MRRSRERWAWALGFFGLNVVGVSVALASDATFGVASGALAGVVGAIGFGTVVGFWGSLLYPVAWIALVAGSGLATRTYSCPWSFMSETTPQENRPHLGLTVGPRGALPHGNPSMAPGAGAIRGAGVLAATRGKPCANGSLPRRQFPLAWHAILAIEYGGPLALAAGGATSLGRIDRRRRERARGGYSSSGSP